MKRKFFAVFAVMLVLALATCDSGETPTTEGDMVHLTINVGDVPNRALTLNQAQGVVNAAGGFFEVVFKNSSDVYRSSWDYGTTGEIDVPAATYTGPTQAVVFAGRKSDFTLLAIGVITKVNTTPVSPGAAATIGTGTTSVTFTLSALLSGVTNTTSSSAFQILGPVSAAPNTDTDFTTAHKGIGTISGHPFFYLPAATYTGYVDDSSTATDATTLNKVGNIVGCYTINCGTAGASNSYYGGVIVKTWSVTPATPGADNTANLINDSFIPRYPGTNAALADGEFYFNIKTNTTGAGNGYCQVSLEASVVAIIDQNGLVGDVTPVAWKIRGGLNNTTIDNANNGGAFVLKVGNLISIDINVDPL